jgi:hypothetical protein
MMKQGLMEGGSKVRLLCRYLSNVNNTLLLGYNSLVAIVIVKFLIPRLTQYCLEANMLYFADLFFWVYFCVFFYFNNLISIFDL